MFHAFSAPAKPSKPPSIFVKIKSAPIHCLANEQDSLETLYFPRIFVKEVCFLLVRVTKAQKP